MARMHTRKRGKSGSKQPLRDGKPSWVTQSSSEIEQLVVKLKKEGMTKSKIGMILRDQYGIPKVKDMTGKRISSVLEANSITDQMPEDIIALMRKAVNLSKHLISNPKDLKNKRGLQLIEAKIKRLADYYKRNNKLPRNWTYSIDKAELLVK
ncbi:MAG: 30S ribosomal protein S15 [Candidatus Thermoplasmatota archaeon]|jgi:small subunit ribosomal protein S15|nr:30S ribosomal protein S15 [Candidatus Thermoplasmatota archaeon]